eukprot:GHVS01056910.1.p1 GENE.GHVS01056910.1~~GHVS01056910.1.p1  ORF type:complete len:626 (+),score=149.07 GHVS01056910.1:89-1966(+)
MSRYYPVAHHHHRAKSNAQLPFHKLQPSREDDLRHNISALSRLLTNRSSTVPSRPPLISPPPPLTTATSTPPRTICSSFAPRQIISSAVVPSSQQLIKPKLTAPVALLPAPACSIYESFTTCAAPSTSSSSPCLSPSTTSTTAVTADRNFSPISVACSSPSLPPLLPSDSIELSSSSFSLPPPTSSISSSSRPTIAANQTRVRNLQRGIVRLQLAVKVCEAQRARRSKFFALSGKNWNSLRNVPKLGSSSARRAPPLTSAYPGTKPTTTIAATASIRPQQQLSAAAVNSKHRNLTLVNYPSMRNMSLSIGRISSFPCNNVEHVNCLPDDKDRHKMTAADSGDMTGAEGGDNNKTADGDVVTANFESARKKQSRFKTLTFCKFYNKTGRCRRGEDCPFYHDPYRSLRHPVLPFLSDGEQLTGGGVPQGQTKPTTPEQTEIGVMSRKLLFVLSCDDNKVVLPLKRKTADHRRTSIEQSKRPRMHSMIRYHHQCPQDEQEEHDSSDDESTSAPAADNLSVVVDSSCSTAAATASLGPTVVCGDSCPPLSPRMWGAECCSAVCLGEQKQQRGGDADKQRRPTDDGDDCVQIVNDSSNNERLLLTRMQRSRRYFSMVDDDDDEQSDETAD